MTRRITKYVVLDSNLVVWSDLKSWSRLKIRTRGCDREEGSQRAAKQSKLAKPWLAHYDIAIKSQVWLENDVIQYLIIEVTFKSILSLPHKFIHIVIILSCLWDMLDELIATEQLCSLPNDNRMDNHWSTEWST